MKEIEKELEALRIELKSAGNCRKDSVVEGELRECSSIPRIKLYRRLKQRISFVFLEFFSILRKLEIAFLFFLFHRRFSTQGMHKQNVPSSYINMMKHLILHS